MTYTSLVKQQQGVYLAEGLLQSQNILDTAASILLEGLNTGQPLSKPEDAAKFLQISLANEPNEQFAALFLNSKNIVISFDRLFSGTIDRASVYPRVVVQKALACNASAVIFAHNHPSGDPDPSRSDKKITKDLVDALGMIDVRVLDHFVVGHAEWISLARLGWL